VECAPFARALTGIALSGDAADWWPQAAGRYERSRQPEVGSVLVFRRSARLPSGHVSVVSRVLSPRQVLVTQANWVHHRVTEDQPVVDVSPVGDWTLVRVWWPPAGQMGTGEYPAFGFIRPKRPISRERLVAGTPAAVRVAEGR
jgi:surface antigen